MTKVYEEYGCGNALYTGAVGFLASLECELEWVRNGGNNIGAFRCEKDGSLRNNGFEYISAVGKDRKALVEDFEFLHKNITFYAKEDPFSARTSTHVHVNVCTLEMEQVRNLVLLYALFEEFFFAMVKPVRRDNIHCVPLTETYLPNHYNKSAAALLPHWHKYTALNMKRVTDLGTLEFRHLHGTGDSKEVETWLHVLENLWKLCQRVDINEQTLSDKNAIQEWFELIFFPADRIIMLKPSLFDIIKNSLIDVKFSTI